jgi:hypothetical protein
MDDATQARLTKLLPMLGSDQQGEILAAVSRIKATLAGAGLDLHDLAQGKLTSVQDARQRDATILVLRSRISDLQREAIRARNELAESKRINNELRRLLDVCESARVQIELPLKPAPPKPTARAAPKADPRLMWQNVLSGLISEAYFRDHFPDWVSDEAEPEDADDIDLDNPWQ